MYCTPEVPDRGRPLAKNAERRPSRAESIRPRWKRTGISGEERRMFGCVIGLAVEWDFGQQGRTPDECGWQLEDG